MTREPKNHYSALEHLAPQAAFEPLASNAAASAAPAHSQIVATRPAAGRPALAATDSAGFLANMAATVPLTIAGLPADVGEPTPNALVDDRLGRRAVPLGDIEDSEGFAITGAASGDQSGTTVAGIGDINGDGFDDWLIGAPFSDRAGSEFGTAYVMFGKAGVRPDFSLANFTAQDGFVITGGAFFDAVGGQAARVGDVNGDGLADFILAYEFGDRGSTNAGGAVVIFGKAGATRGNISLGSLGGTDGVYLNGPAGGGRVGESVSGAGDVNGDGLADRLLRRRDHLRPGDRAN